jgi:hypothetical protein
MTQKQDGTAGVDGVFKTKQKAARIFAEIHDKDVIQTDGGWLAKNRDTQSGPMPTKRGDVVVRHIDQRYDIWLVPEEGAQDPGAEIEPRQVWNLREAEQIVRELTEGTRAQVFRLQKNGAWDIQSD